MRVYRSDPNQRGFSHPCPLWQGQCTIHTSRHYPHICRAYKCKLLKEVLAGSAALPDALALIEQARGMIHELESLLSVPAGVNFRERLVARLEHPEEFAAQQPAESDFQPKAQALLVFYEKVFGVNDLLEKPNDKVI